MNPATVVTETSTQRPVDNFFYCFCSEKKEEEESTSTEKVSAWQGPQEKIFLSLFAHFSTLSQRTWHRILCGLNSIVSALCAADVEPAPSLLSLPRLELLDGMGCMGLKHPSE